MKRKRELSEEGESEDWCFVCKEGGNLLLCDFDGCVKSYHRKCAGKHKSVMKSSEPWICSRHRCSFCKLAPKFYCLSCPNSICQPCLSSVEFFPVKAEKGLCKDCLELAFTVEEFPEPELDLIPADLNDEDMFKDYLEIIMEQEGLKYDDFHQAKLRRSEQIDCSSDLIEILDDVQDAEPVVAEGEHEQSEKPEAEVLTSESGKGGGLGRVDCKERSEPKSCEEFLEKDPNFQVQKSLFASIGVKNMKLIYLKRTLVEKLVAETDSFEEMLVGCFVGVRKELENGFKNRSYEVLPVTGISRSMEDSNGAILLQISCIPSDVPISLLSDDEITEEQCLELQKKVKDGLLKRLTVEELERKATRVHEDITKHGIQLDLARLQKLIDFANEKGRRARLELLLDRRTALMTPHFQQHLLSKLPRVIAEEI